MKGGRGAIAALGLLTSLALIWFSAVAVPSATSRAATPQADKFSQAERLVFFRLEPNEVLRIPLPPNSDALRLLTHVVLPEGTQYAPERQWVYGVDVQITDEAGGELERRAVFARTRQSKGEPVGGEWLRESAFTSEPAVQLTDGRELLVPLSGAARGPKRILQVRYPGAVGSLLVRVYGRTPQDAPLFAKHQDSLRRRAEHRADQATFLPWSMLDPEDHARILSAQWERLSAEGELELDYRTLVVYRTDYRLPLVEVEESSRERLSPGRAMAINLVGPVDPTLWLWSTARRAAQPEAREAVRVSSLDTEGQVREWRLPAPAAGQASAHVLRLEAGLHTLSIENLGKEELHYTLEAPAKAALTPPDRAGPEARDALGLLPDHRRGEAWVAGPQCSAIELEVGADPGERLFRLDARVLADEKNPLGPALLRVQLLDEENVLLSELPLPLDGMPAPYESAQVGAVDLPCLAPLESTHEQTSLEVTDWPVLVSTSHSGRLFVPANARRIRVLADRSVAVQLYRFHANEQGSSTLPPYDGEFEHVRWRHRPLVERHWYPMRPANHRDLHTEGARISVVSQVRLEPIGPADVAAPSTPAVSVIPYSPPRSVALLEPVSAAEARDRLVYTQLKANEPVALRFGGDSARRPELKILTSSTDSLGKNVELYVDGRRVHRRTLRASSLRALLSPVPAGDHEVELRTDASDLVVAMNRPSVGGLAQAWVERTAYALTSRGMRIPVYKPSADPVTLNVVLYGTQRQSPAGAVVGVTIDRGQPSRRQGVFLERLTRAVREVPLPDSDRRAVAPLGGEGRWFARSVAVTLGDDLGPGLHTVHVKPAGTGPLWARFFVHGARRGEVKRQWIREGWEEETP